MVVIRFLGRQSSMAPDGSREEDPTHLDGVDEKIGDVIQLLYCSSQGDVEGVKSLLEKGVEVNSSDFDKRTALHVAACEGKKEMVELLIAEGAEVNSKDRWGSTPLADARHYNWDDVGDFIEAKGGQLPDTSPMRVCSSIKIPEYEIDREELVLINERDSYAIGKWRGTKVFMKIISIDKGSGKTKLREFVSELSLMLKLRHPNVVQFLGAVTQSMPAMIVTEYLSKGDLQQYLEKKKEKPLKPGKALKFAMDIARGLNYVHEFKPEPVVHSNLKPSNLLRDKAGHLKITDFAFTKYGDHEEAVQISGRYMAPELYLKSACGTKADVFSFSLIVQEMMEGTPPFPKLEPEEVARAYSEGKRPPFKVKPRYYPEGLKELIEECWHENPQKRPAFKVICKRLEDIKINYSSDSFKSCITTIRYSKLFGR